MTPNYTVKKSVMCSLSLWLILFSWLVIPLIVQICRIISAMSYSVEFYDNKVVVKSGVFNKDERQVMFIGVNAVSIHQTLGGRIFGYGDVYVDCRGEWDVDTNGIKNPAGLKRYVESKISGAGVRTVIKG